MMQDFEIEFDELIELKCIDAADCHAHAVTEEMTHMRVFEKAGVLAEYGAIVRLFHVGFERHKALTSRLVQQLVTDLKRGEIALARERRAFKDLDHAADDVFENVQRIADQHSSCRRAADDDQLGRLDEDSDIAMLHEIPAEHGSEDNDDSDNGKHCGLWSGRGVPQPERAGHHCSHRLWASETSRFQ